MKNILGTPFLITLSLALMPLTSRASVPFADGNLAVVFYSTNGDPLALALGAQYFVFNLGPASLYRENTVNDVPVSTVNPALASSNVATDLVAQFGSTWATDGAVRMFVTTTVPVQPSGNALNGDTNNTFYFSIPRTSLDNGQTGPGVTLPSTFQTSLATSAANLINVFLYTGTNSAITPTPQNGYINSNPTVPPFGNPAGVRLPISGNLINLSLYVPPVTNNVYFDIGRNPAAVLSTSTLPGSAGVKGAVAIYRVLPNLTDVNGGSADLTSGSSTGNAIRRGPQYIGSLSIDTSGTLKMGGVGVAPASGNFYTFATANSPNLAGGPNGDADFDGINNLTEYALNTNLTGSDGSVGTFIGGELTFTKRAAAVANGDLTYAIEISTDLGISDLWAPLSPVSNTNASIIGTIPTGPVKNFARLRVISSAVAP